MLQHGMITSPIKSYVWVVVGKIASDSGNEDISISWEVDAIDRAGAKKNFTDRINDATLEVEFVHGPYKLA